MKSRPCLGEIRPRSSEMLLTQREIFAEAKVISNKHKFVGVDVLDNPFAKAKATGYKLQKYIENRI